MCACRQRTAIREGLGIKAAAVCRGGGGYTGGLKLENNLYKSVTMETCMFTYNPKSSLNSPVYLSVTSTVYNTIQN